MSALRLLPLIAAGAALSSTVRAQLVAWDGFGEYAAGAQLEGGANGSAGPGVDGGFGWAGPYDVNNAIKSLVRAEDRSASPVLYANGDLTLNGGQRALRLYDVANGTSAVRRPLGTVFQAAAGEDLWFSFLFRTNNASPLANQDFLQAGFEDAAGAGTGNPRVSIGVNTITTTFPPPQPFRFFARSTTTVANTVFDHTTDIAAATTYFLVGHVAAAGAEYGLVELFVNPRTATVPAAPSASLAISSGLGTLSWFVLRTSALDAGDAFVLDELKIGRSYAAVILPEPPPFLLTFEGAGPPGAIGTLRWHAQLNGVLETSSTLTPDLWTVISGPFTPDGSDLTWPVPNLPGFPRAFFRLRR